MAADTSLENVKKVLMSILVSMADEPVITVGLLSKKYRDYEGIPIPFYNLGFKRIEDFLQSIPDVLKVEIRV